MTPALFLDRDGVINEEGGYLYRIEDFHFVDGIFSLCRTAQVLGYRIVIVTNQAGIARGLYTTQDFETLMAHVRAEFKNESVHIDAVYHSPFHPNHGPPEFRQDHPFRKPSPGMLLQAAADLDLDLPRSIMVGDRCTDIAAANSAGLRQAFLIAGSEPNPCPGQYIPIQSHAEAEAWLTQNP